jgi:hypothetical protein
LLAAVRNTTGATLTKGTAVYISGATGQISTVSKALATSDATSAQTLGLITSNLANNSNGYVTVIGLITNINTSAYTDGQQLYLSPTTAGTLTATKPYAPQHLVYVAIVEHAHPTQGKLFVKVQNGYEMDELHNVSAQSPTTGQTLVYNASTSLWEKSFAPVISGTTIDNTVIGGTTAAAGTFTTLTATGQTSLGGDASNPSFRANAVSGVTRWIEASGSVSGTPQFSASSTGSATGINFVTRGASGFNFSTNTSASTVQLAVSHTASAVNYVQVTGAATGSGPTISAQGSDTNADLNVTAKGTGGARFNVGNGSKYTYLSSDAANNFQLIGGVGATNLGIYATGGGSIRFYTASGLLEEQLRIPQTASAVNYIQIAGATTGNGPTISAQGSDATAQLNLTGKGGSGVVIFNNGTATPITFSTTPTASSVNYLNVTGSVTGFGPKLSALGSDTNIPLVLQPKGTGALQAQQTDSTATGGNARGTNAVDWQTSRDTAAKVASSTYSVLSGGNSNRSTSYASALVGGLNNGSLGGYSFVGGGLENSSSSSYTVMVGGFRNNATGPYNFVGGGYANSGTSNSTVTTQSATMNGTTAVTLSASNASIKVGQYIAGTHIATYPADTYVAAISGTSLTLSQAASGSGTATLSFFTPHGVVVGGGNNTATGSYSFIGGGGDAGTAGNRNVASGDWSFVGGGFKNTASGLYSSIAGGFTNTASGSNSFVSGSGSTASGSVSAVIGSNQSSATNFDAVVVGGQVNTASGIDSGVFAGAYGITRGLTGATVFPASTAPITTTQGVSQSALLVLGRQTTDATPTVLCSNSVAASTTNQIILPNNSAYFFTGEVIAGVTGGGNTKGWTIEGVIKRGANAASTALVGTPTVTSTYADAGASTWVIAVTADTTNGGLAVTFTGQASTTIRTVCQLRTTEMTF